jgi:hypothetical protein
VNVTSDTTYGVPPIELNGTAGHDAGDLPQHGIYETYFSEFSFRFSPADQTDEYNTQDNPGTVPTPGSGMYWAAFSIDAANLDADYALHFDLYSEEFISRTHRGTVTWDADVDQFAPFSHDAQSGKAPLPEPGTFLLLGSGLLVVAAAARFRKSGGQA